MQFRLHINDTNDGTIIARELRQLASQLDGHPLTNGLRLDLHSGYATMTIEPVEYRNCADAERQLGLTLDWQEQDQRFVGRNFGQPVAATRKRERSDAWERVFRR